jgi:hypothetical protein
MSHIILNFCSSQEQGTRIKMSTGSYATWSGESCCPSYCSSILMLTSAWSCEMMAPRCYNIRRQNTEVIVVTSMRTSVVTQVTARTSLLLTSWFNI